MTTYIKKLELQGFKSFSERTKVLFHPGITAIVGPNGTGKSNIVDGLLWVLGGQRPRAVRGEKIDDIIFNGNTKKPAMGMADVTVALEDEPEELVINHRAFRTGEGEYRMNGKAVRLKDIQDELWKRAIGDKEYFIIEQGSIGQFVTSKPTEKRLLIEAAAGTAFYKDKRRLAENKLEDSEQNLVRLEDIIAEVSRAKNSLARQAHAAIRYRKIRERIRELTGVHYRRRLLQLEKSQSEVADRFTEFVIREKDILAQAQAAEADVSLKRRDLWELEKTLKQDQEILYSLKSHIARLESEGDKEAKRAEFFAEKNKRAIASKDEYLEEVLLLEKEIVETNAGLEAVRAELEAKRKEAAEAEEAGKSLKAEFSAQVQDLEALKQDYVDRVAVSTQARNELAKLDKEWELILRQEEKLGERLAKERARLEENLKQLALFAETRELLHADLDQNAGKASDLRAALAETEQRHLSLQSRAEELKRQRDENAIRLQALKKLAEAERGKASSQDVPGALGVLADLVEADAEATPWLDVLWKEEARAAVMKAEDLLGILEDKGLKGRFLLLAPEPAETASPDIMNEPGVLGLLRQRLHRDSRFGGLLSRLPDAVVVSDVRSAVKLWSRFPGHNYVTPQGGVLFASGLLKLGEKEEGAFGLALEIRALEEDLGRRDTELRPVTDALAAEGREKQSLEENLRSLGQRQAEIERLIQDEDNKRVLALADKDKQAGEITLLEKELNILAEEKSALAADLERLKQKAQEAESQAGAWRERTEAAEASLAERRERAAQLEQRAIELRGAVEVLREKASSLTRLGESLAQRREAAAAKIRATEDESRQCDEEEERLRVHMADLAAKAQGLEAERQDREKQGAVSDAKVLQMRSDLDELEARLKARREDQERVKDERVKWEVSRAEVERDLVNLEEMCWQELRKNLSEVRAEVTEAQVGGSEVEQELEDLKEDLQRYKAVNLMAEEEYTAQKQRYDFLVKQRDDLRQSIVSTKEAILKIDEESKTMFLTALAEVNTNFQQVFAILFNGGTAEVKLTEPENPLESGVEIVAQPPGKKVQSMTLLSGGEKSLTSLAFLFALFRYKPAPFCILDEVDAALDDVNLGRFLELMKKVKQDTQFIIVTHNYKTMEVADFIYGTTMSEPNVTNIYSIKLDKKDKEASPQG